MDGCPTCSGCGAPLTQGQLLQDISGCDQHALNQILEHFNHAGFSNHLFDFFLTQLLLLTLCPHKTTQLHFELISMSHFCRKTRKTLKNTNGAYSTGIFLQLVSHQICDLYFYFSFFPLIPQNGYKGKHCKHFCNSFICSSEKRTKKVNKNADFRQFF